VDSPSFLATAIGRLAGLPLRGKIFVFACTVVTIELAFRYLAPRSKAYALWTKAFESVGKVWTAVLLSVIYFLSVSIVSVFMKVSGKDPLDRSLDTEPSFWRKHEPNPLGPHAAARHQF
jgi:hypothetical protein